MTFLQGGPSEFIRFEGAICIKLTTEPHLIRMANHTLAEQLTKLIPKELDWHHTSRYPPVEPVAVVAGIENNAGDVPVEETAELPVGGATKSGSEGEGASSARSERSQAFMVKNIDVTIIGSTAGLINQPSGQPSN